MVGNVLQAPPAPLHRCALCTWAAGLCIGSRAQLVRLRPDQDDDAHSRMGHTVSDKRVYCHEALHMREKLTKAGYKQKVEKWDSDSDSDSSDEEDLAV